MLHDNIDLISLMNNLRKRNREDDNADESPEPGLERVEIGPIVNEYRSVNKLVIN